ncbi:arsenite methyltransferase [Halogeometricum sp. S1BR25-6]|uniref:Arsenite methyltransferase n=1 Tax=Halogeometricum salsisoli TaxID=2950536 RepID=A0ABU2G9D6_9EURY|nr:arsenite methyltransferase [Halogeometricum sp. S1BR25-6]MDS0297421.1 arsenite methyltransferase [Halogeometricum sp. S1BR25-6]
MSDSEDGGSADAPTDSLDPAAQRRAVRERYARIATAGSASDSTSDSTADSTDDDGGCCDADAIDSSPDDSTALGYTDDDVAAVADGADLGLGCGNPNAIAALEPGETVLDLGSGAGFDCFLAAREVGESGRVVGVDMTPEMVEKARANVRKNDATNVEFRLGEIENLPVADGSVDVVISNCVINLSPDKPRVFREAYRALRPGGRLAVSDVVLTASLPDDVRHDPDSVAACVAGASTVEEVEEMLTEAGFEDVDISPKEESAEFIGEWDDSLPLEEYVVSATIEARKPA